MDFYFTDRKFNLIEIASTDGQAPYQLSVAADLESINAGARTLSGTLVFTKEQANRINQMAALGNYVLYHDKFGNDRFMTIMDIRHDPLNGTHDFTAEDAGVDLINETIGAYTADKAYDIAYYINKFTYDSGFKIGTNEISTLSRKLKWEGTDETALARVLSVATQFDAELDFSFEISGTNVVKRYINIYKHRGADNQIRLYLDKDINNIVTTGDIYDLYTSVYATGGTPEGSDKPITLKGYKWTDTDGRYELGADGILRDTVAVQLWSRLLSNDNPNPIKSHIQRSKIYEATTQASLLQSALGGLKKAANPAINYEVDIAVLPDNVTVGDTVHIVDDNEDLYLSARVLELKYDYALEQYTATLGDYLIEHDQVSSDLRELADQVKNMPKVVQYYPWVRYADDADGNGFSMFPQDKAYMAVIYGKTSTPSDNPSDYSGKWQRVVGPNGQDGADGIVGPAGEDGQTSYFHRAYANSLDGKTDFSVTDGNGKSYMGTYSDFIKADSTDPTKYNWALFKGPQGVKGDPGANGSKGPAGADGKSSYLHTAYAQSADGKTGFSTTDATDATYIGVYSDQTETDSTDPAKYSWMKAQGPAGADGAQGTPGKAGADGRTPYVHYAWATNSTGTTGFSTTDANGKTYVGVCTDYNQADPTTPSSYTWSLFVGPKGDKGEAGVQGLQGPKGDQGIAGPKGSDGKTQYTHIAYANSADGKTDFTVSDSNREYIGMYVDFTATDSTTPADYSWTLVKGANGANGTAGKPGADGKTPYFHTAWANSADGKTDFSTTVSANKKYLGTCTDFTSADPTDYTKYAWSLIQGPKGDKGDKGDTGVGVAGPKGEDGRTPYTHTAWSWSSDGSDRFMTGYPNENLFQGSSLKDLSVFGEWVPSGGKSELKDGIYTYSTGTTSQGGLHIYYEKDNLIPNETYSISLLTKGNGNQHITYRFMDTTGTWGAWSVASEMLTATNTWQTLQGKFTVPNTGYRQIQIAFYVQNTGSIISSTKPKLEEGDTASPYTPSPSDNYQAAYPTYRGEYTDYTETDSTDPKRYTWTRILGEKGQDGAQGTPGKAGADGRTPYFHQAWADSQDGKTNFSTTVSLGKKYLGTYTDFISADSTDPTKYRWTELVGAMEVGGENLIRNGNFINQTSTHWRDWNGATGATREISKPGTDWPANTGGVIHLVNPNGGQWGYAQDNIKVAKGGTYTISVVVTGTQGTKVALQHGNGGTDAWQAKEIVKPTSGMDTLSYTFKVGNDAETTNIYVGFGQNGKGTVWMSRITLQKGNVATDWEPAPGDTDEKIDAIIPPPSSGISYPSNPKKGQQHWLTDANGKPKGLFQYDGSKWVAVPVNADTISANTLNGMTINGVTINGSTINSPNINVPFNNVPANPDEPANSPYAQLVSGTTQLTSNLKISANLTDGTNKTAQWLRTLVSPQGFSNIISTPDASKALSQIDISFGSMFLSEWHEGVTANDGFVSSYFGAGDATTYEYVDALAANDNINSGTVRYTRKGSQVNVGFRFSLKNDTGWVALGKIRTGYTPASLASVGINCPSLSYRGYSCVVYPNNDGWRLIPTSGQGVGTFQGSVSYTTYDYYPYNDAK